MIYDANTNQKRKWLDYYQAKSTPEQRILSGINKDTNCIMINKILNMLGS